MCKNTSSGPLCCTHLFSLWVFVQWKSAVSLLEIIWTAFIGLYSTTKKLGRAFLTGNNPNGLAITSVVQHNKFNTYVRLTVPAADSRAFLQSKHISSAVKTAQASARLTSITSFRMQTQHCKSKTATMKYKRNEQLSVTKSLYLYLKLYSPLDVSVKYIRVLSCNIAASESCTSLRGNWHLRFPSWSLYGSAWRPPKNPNGVALKELRRISAPADLVPTSSHLINPQVFS